MAIETVPLTLPKSADPSKFTQLGREVKGVNPATASDEQFKEIQELLYKASECDEGNENERLTAVVICDFIA